MTAMVYIFLADLQCAKWMPSSLCLSRISLSSSRSSRLYLILSHIVDSLTFFARICDRCKFSSSRALELQRGGQDTIRTSQRNENPLIASSAVRSVLDADISAKNFCKCQGWVLMFVRSDVHSEITSSWHFVCSTRTGIRTS